LKKIIIDQDDEIYEVDKRRIVVTNCDQTKF